MGDASVNEGIGIPSILAVFHTRQRKCQHGSANDGSIEGMPLPLFTLASFMQGSVTTAM